MKNKRLQTKANRFILGISGAMLVMLAIMLTLLFAGPADYVYRLDLENDRIVVESHRVHSPLLAAYL